uniref:Putative protein-lysine deacylase ABHD14B n=1 Tax=Oryzias sinensis TaxID=183150 RepID=A0A8C8DP91_9TELE
MTWFINNVQLRSEGGLVLLNHLSCFCLFRMSAVKMTEGSLLLESCSAPLFYRKSQPSSGDARMFVLLLHGIRFSSENWLSIGTLETLAKAGCCAVAIDLPELGRSKSAKAPAAVGELAPAGFLKEVCEKLNLVPVVVISPSLSGMYSLPFLLEYQALVRAYIPIAPICTEKFTAEQYQSVKVCVCSSSFTVSQLFYLFFFFFCLFHQSFQGFCNVTISGVAGKWVHLKGKHAHIFWVFKAALYLKLRTHWARVGRSRTR